MRERKRARDVPTHGCGREACPKVGDYAEGGGLFCVKCGWLVARDVSREIRYADDKLASG